MKNFKSLYILKNILSFVDEKEKLKLIRYKYKFFNKKYIIYESNEKGKEYNVGNVNLIFEGE